MTNFNLTPLHSAYYQRYQRLLFVFFFLTSIAVAIANYLSGSKVLEYIYFQAAFIVTFLLSILFLRLYTAVRLYNKSKIIAMFPAANLCMDIMANIPFLLFSTRILINANYYYVAPIIFFIISTIRCLIILTFLRELINRDFYTVPARILTSEAGNVSENLIQSGVDMALGQSSGKDKTSIDKVINSILFRSSISSRMISVSLVTMVIIVVVGSSASFGTVAFDQAKKIRELEIERQKLVKMANSLPKLIDTTGIVPIPDQNTAIIKRINSVKELILTQYGNENSYKALLENIQKQSNISWPDITLRISIAALTLFLVQIFFQIYKYNQQQAAHLLDKAELLELFKDDDADKNDLRTGLLSKADSTPQFGKSPANPTEQILNIIGNTKDSK